MLPKLVNVVSALCHKLELKLCETMMNRLDAFLPRQFSIVASKRAIQPFAGSRARVKFSTMEMSNAHKLDKHTTSDNLFWLVSTTTKDLSKWWVAEKIHKNLVFHRSSAEINAANAQLNARKWNWSITFDDCRWIYRKIRMKNIQCCSEYEWSAIYFCTRWKLRVPISLWMRLISM